MIKLSLNSNDIKNLNNQLNMKVQAIGEMTNPKYLQEMAKAAFTLVGERFVLAADRYAVQNPKKMHHVYEWGKLGNPRARLFVIERTRILNGNLLITSQFTKSKAKVPLNPELLIPGKNGRSVTRRSVFADKAKTMESGMPISFQAQRVLAFMGRRGINFIPAGAIVHIQNPGGIATKNSFSKFMLDWYNKNAQSIMDSSGLYQKMAQEASIILNKDNSNSADMQRVIFGLMNQVSKGKDIIK